MPHHANPELELVADDFIQQSEQGMSDDSDEALEQLLPAAEQDVEGEDAMNLTELFSSNADGNDVALEQLLPAAEQDVDTTAASRAETEPERRKKMSDEVLLAFFVNFLVDASSQPFCTKRKCTCLHLLRGPVLRLPVAKYLANLERKSKRVKDQLLLEWYIYAKRTKPPGMAKNSNWYCFPFNGTDTVSDLSLIKTGRICTTAMLTIMEVGQRRYTTIIKSSKTIGVISPSKNTGKNKAFKEDDLRMITVRAHFNELKGLGEIRATRFVDEWVIDTLT